MTLGRITFQNTACRIMQFSLSVEKKGNEMRDLFNTTCSS